MSLCLTKDKEKYISEFRLPPTPRDYFGDVFTSGPGSSVGIATGYGLDGPGIEYRWGGETFRTCPDRLWGPPSLLYNWYRVFPGGKKRPGCDADPSHTSSAVVKKE